MSHHQLWKYARDGNLKRIIRRVELKGKDIINTEKDESDGSSALLDASYHGHLSIVQYLVSNGARINDKDIYGSTALHWASSNGYLPVVEYLISNGSNVNDQKKDGNTALHRACNPNPSFPVSNSTAIEIIKVLVANGADETIRNNKNKTPAEWAENETLRNALAQAVQEVQLNEFTNSSSTVISIEELLNCPQCEAPYTDPRLLPCEHTLCFTCVEQIQNSKEMKTRICPVDKTAFPVNLKPTDLPQNLLCSALATVLPNTNFNPSKPTTCANCSEKLASLWCEGCGDLCEACSEFLHSIAVMKSHKSTSLEDKKHTALIPKCSTHGNKDMDLYCPKCKVLICYVCEKASHSTHKCILVLDAAKSSKNSLKSNLVSFLRKRNALQQMIVKKRGEIKAAEVRQTQLLAEIEKIHNEIEHISQKVEKKNKKIDVAIQQFNHSETLSKTVSKMIDDVSNFDILDQKVFEKTQSLVGSVYKAFYKEEMVYMSTATNPALINQEESEDELEIEVIDSDEEIPAVKKRVGRRAVAVKKPSRLKGKR